MCVSSMAAARILVVDDDAVTRRILEHALSETGYEVAVAGNGVEALLSLQNDHAKTDLVILDRQMPKMDGLTVLRALRRLPADARPAIVMVTAQSSARVIAEELAAGAHYHLTKPVARSVLLAVVDAAIRQRATQKWLKGQMEERVRGARLMTRAEFRLRTPEEAADLAAFIAPSFPEPAKAGPGLLELLMNAVEHGNLELGGENKQTLLLEGTLESWIKGRLQSSPYRERFAVVSLEVDPNEVSVTIRDEGPGFDHVKWGAEGVTDASLHGRGISAARFLSFDTLHYPGAGNEVRAAMKWERPTADDSHDLTTFERLFGGG